MRNKEYLGRIKCNQEYCRERNTLYYHLGAQKPSDTHEHFKTFSNTQYFWWFHVAVAICCWKHCFWSTRRLVESKESTIITNKQWNLRLYVFHFIPLECKSLVSSGFCIFLFFLLLLFIHFFNPVHNTCMCGSLILNNVPFYYI